MRKFLGNNGLSLVLFGLFFFTFLFGQSVVGSWEYNDDSLQHGQPIVTYFQYLATPHFLKATMENWESEFLLFAISFFLPAVGGAGEYNSEMKEHGKTEHVSAISYMGTSRFWFESLQNWQSEFLAVGSMVVLTIFLREKGSHESKPVDSPHSQTGD